MRHRRQGFILIIVVAVLGVLAALATQLAQSSIQARMLSGLQVATSRVRLMCRSGLEFGIIKHIERLASSQGGGGSSSPTAYDVVLDPVAGADHTWVVIKDTAGCINPNDGIRAGLMELGTNYIPNQVDPWPMGSAATPWPTNPADLDDPLAISGMINLRLRALLNAYGDVHRYLATDDLGWPGTPGHVPGTPFTFTSTESAPRGISIPGMNSIGDTLTTNEDCGAMSMGLGDRVVGSRPADGYSLISQVATIIDAWGVEFLDPAYLAGDSFFEKVSDDIALGTFEDDRFFRLREEHGLFEADHMKPTNKRSQIRTRMFLDSNPPDFVNRQKFFPHSVALINLNSASDFVKAAVFYAPSNVSYQCEGTALDLIKPKGKYVAMKNGRDWVGVGGPSFNPAIMMENGVVTPNNHQPDRLMSLTDSLKLSTLYGQATTRPLSFPQFAHWLSIIRKSGQMTYERAMTRTFGGHRLPYITPPNEDASIIDLEPAYFTQEYVELTLPHVFSCNRRLPGYMGAPMPLLSPYLQQGEHRANWTHQTYQGPALRSVEDVVYRSHIPKVAFLPHGPVRIRSKGVLVEGVNRMTHTLTAELVLHETKLLRTQKDFEDHTDFSATSPAILIGPEPRQPGALPPYSPVPSERFGVVGLRDTCENYPQDSNGQVRAKLDFNGNLNAVAGSSSNLIPKNSSNDQEIRGEGTEITGGYPVLGPNGDSWAVVQSKLNNLRNIMGIYTDPWDPYTTWRVPPDTRDLRVELYRKMTNSHPPDEPTMNSYFAANASLFVGTSGSVDLVRDPGQTFDEMSYNVTRLVGHSDLLPDSATIWALWATLGPDQPVNWRVGAPRQGDRPLVASPMEGPGISMFGTGSTGCDLSPFGGLMFSSRGHGVRANKSFADSFYLRPAEAFGPAPVKIGPRFNRGYVSLWVRMPSGYHSSNVRRSIFQLNLHEKALMRYPSAAFPGGLAKDLHQNLTTSGPTIMTYRPVQFSLYLEGDTSVSPNSEALYTVVGKHQKDCARRAYNSYVTYPEEWDPYNLTPVPISVTNANFLSSTLPNSLSPSTQYGYPANLNEPFNKIMYSPVVDHATMWLNFSALLDPKLLRYPDQNANYSMELQEDPYSNLPGGWRRVVCRWDLQIPPAGTNERFAVVTDPHMSGVSRLQTSSLLPNPFHPEKTRPYHGVRDDNPGTIWSFGEVVTCFDPEFQYGSGVQVGAAGLWEAYPGGKHTNFLTDHPNELLDPSLQPLYPSDFPYPVLTPGHTYPLMRLNSSIDNIVIRMGETAAASIPDNVTQAKVASWVQSSIDTQARRYDVNDVLDPPNEPFWSIDPDLPLGTRLLYVGARIYDLPFLIDAADAGKMPPWQAPRVDFVARDGVVDMDFPLDQGPSTAASHNGHVYTSPAFRRPLKRFYAGPEARLELKYLARDANDVSLSSDGYNWNFNDIPWITEVSWSYVPKQVKYLSFQWE